MYKRWSIDTKEEEGERNFNMTTTPPKITP
jgi:hypothetical protein